MADNQIVITLPYTADLDRGPVEQYLPVAFGTGDKEAHKLVLTAYRATGIVDLTGAGVLCYVNRADKSTVVINGRVEDGKAVVLLPEECYIINGTVSIIVKLTMGDTRATVLWLTGSINRTSNGKLVDPGGVVPTLEDLLAEIANMRTATADATEAAEDAREAAKENENRTTEAINEMAQTVAAAAPSITSESSGNILNLRDAAARPAVALSTEIRAVQAGTGNPSPDNIRPLTGWDAVSVSRTGRNLVSHLDYVTTHGHKGTTITPDVIEVTSPESYDYGYIPVHLKAGVTYTLVVDVEVYGRAEGNSSSTQIGYRIGTPTDKPYTQLIKANGHYRYVSKYTPEADMAGRVQWDPNYGNSGGKACSRSTIMLLEGDYTEATAPAFMSCEKAALSAALPETVWGGTLDWLTGLLTVTHGHIAAYAGETVPDGWISSVGALTDGAQVVYPLAEPYTIQLAPQTLDMLKGNNTVWSDCGDTAVSYVVDTKTYVDAHAVGGSGGSVASVNGKTGAVVLNAADVGAMPADAQIVDADAREQIAALSEENAKIIGAFPSGSTVVKDEYPIEWVAGTINEGEESPANSTIRIRSSNIEVGKGVFIEITKPDEYTMAKNVYTSEGSWLGQVYQDATGNVLGASSGFGVQPLDVDTVLSVFPNAAYVRLVLRKVDNSALLPEEGFNVKATGESVNTGDWNGGHLDNYYVRKEKAAYSASEIVFTYDVDETIQTRGFLKLPPNYAPVGNPVPLIVFVHGSGDLNSITATAMTDTYEQYYNFLRDSGYAVFDCYSFGNKYSGEDTWGLPINRKCYAAGIRYVCKTYNVDIDNVFVSCKSLGGIQALSMFYDETMPVKAVGMLAPELDPFNVYMGYAEISKRNIAAELGFSEDTGNVLAFNQGDSVPEGFWDYITENMGKWSGQFAFFCGLPIKASEKATYYRKGHTTGDMCRTSLNRPVKIWIAEDDNAVSYAVSSAFIQSLNNGGYRGELRTMPSGTGKHHAVDNDANALQTTNVTTKCGIIYATVPTAYYELVQFFDKYCHK